MRLGARIAIGGLSLSAAGLLAIADFEGFQSEAYIPISGDVPTIGFGHTDGVKIGDKVTVPQALNLLEADTRAAQDAVRKCVTVPLSQGEFDAFTSLAYNIGTKAFCESTLVQKVNARDYDGACQELLRWVYSGGKKVKGLENRRLKELEMCTEK